MSQINPVHVPLPLLAYTFKYPRLRLGLPSDLLVFCEY